jgi:hypothetical protein
MFANGQTFTGAQLCAYDRNAMLTHASSPAAICFPVANDGNFLPSDLDGATPPTDGTPGLFLNFETTSSLRLYQLSPNFTTPSSSTFTHASPDMTVAAFTPACNGGACIAQPNNQKLDSLGDRLMYRLAYRMFGDHASMVVNHSVAAASSVGVRWYELQAPLATPTQFGVYQQGTFAPDSAYRWMGSAAMDGAGNIAIGYSKSSSSIYPSIAITSRTSTMPTGAMGTETILQAGKGAQTTYNRWGDYSALRIDPDDDKTFWYTNEYYTSNNPFFNFNWSTAIASFAVGAANSTPDFTIAVSSPSLTVRRSSNNSTTVTVTATNTASTVNLSVSGLPQRTSANFSTNPVSSTTGGATSTLTISAGRNAPVGTYTLTVTGNNGSISRVASFKLTVQ